MIRVKAVMPCPRPGSSDFKMKPYEAWLRVGGEFAPHYYPPRRLHSIAYKVNFPSFWKKGNEARLRFVEASSISFDTFPDYMRYEIIPLIWDCWPKVFEKTALWFKSHRVRTAIFTSSQIAGRMKMRFPEMNILTITEGVNINEYKPGRILKDREVNVFEMGSIKRSWFKKKFPTEYRELFNKPKECFPKDRGTFHWLLENSKVSIMFTRFECEPELSNGVDTLTQRYWECMLSCILMVGHAPKELIELLGYNPVIELDKEHAVEHIQSILAEIKNGSYQELVNKNREVALRKASWDIRMQDVRKWLREIGYGA